MIAPLLAGAGGIMLVAALLLFVLNVLSAPEGYEDATGFHLGKPPAHRPHNRNLPDTGGSEKAGNNIIHGTEN